MCLLNKDTPSIWDEQAWESFNALKKSLALALMLSPPDYSHEFLLYVTAYQEMIGMVLGQEDDELQEHVVYYFSWNLIDVKLKYSHVEKLSLMTVHAIPVETLHTPSPNYMRGSYQSISVCHN